MPYRRNVFQFFLKFSMGMVFLSVPGTFFPALPDTPVPWREMLSKADGLRLKIRKVLPPSLFGVPGKAEVQAGHEISPGFQG